MKKFDELWPKVVAGDNDALGELYKLNYGLLIRIAQRYSSNKPLTQYGRANTLITPEDLVNDAMLEIKKYAKEITPAADPFVNYFSVVCRNMANGAWRREKRYIGFQRDETGDELIPIDKNKNTELTYTDLVFLKDLGLSLGKETIEPTDLILAALQNVIDNTNQQLKSGQRISQEISTARMRFIENKTTKEISQSRNITMDGVSRQLNIFKRRVLKFYGEENPLHELMRDFFSKSLTDERLNLLHGKPPPLDSDGAPTAGSHAENVANSKSKNIIRK